MAKFVLNAQSRAEDKQGKGASRRLRREALVPAIIYGGNAEPEAVTLELREVAKVIEDQDFFSSIVTINVNGTAQEVLIKALQRHPSKNSPMHADFQRIVRGEELKTQVPFNLLNAETAKGVKAGGVVEVQLVDIEISVLPRNLPTAIDVDLANVDVNEVVRLSDVQLPEGVTLTTEDLEQPVVTIAYVKAEETTEEASEEGGEE